MPKWLIALIAFVVAAWAAQWSQARAAWADPRLPVMSLANGESVMQVQANDWRDRGAVMRRFDAEHHSVVEYR